MVKHGMAGTRTYRIWKDMRRRCLSRKRSEYLRYGGRGISVCKRWQSFSAFLMDMGKAPVGWTIERVNNEKGYSKKNCKWASRAEQSRNTASTVRVTYNGRTLCLADWALQLKIPATTLYSRVGFGWTPPKLFAPSGPQGGRS